MDFEKCPFAVGSVVVYRPSVKGRGVPEWLQFDAAALSGKIGSVPTREQINLPVQEQLIVELYSK